MIRPGTKNIVCLFFSLYKNLCSGDDNELLNEDMNENELTASFSFSAFNSLFNYAKEDLVIKWGKQSLFAKKKKKKEEHKVLDDNHRRSPPGPIIDIFKTKKHGKVGFLELRTLLHKNVEAESFTIPTIPLTLKDKLP